MSTRNKFNLESLNLNILWKYLVTVYSYPIAVKSSQSPRKDLVYSISSRRSLNQIFFTGST